MSILGFLFHLGIINIIFGFLWKWVIVLPAAVVITLLKVDVIGMRVVKVFGTYLLVSLTAILTLVALGEEPSGLSVIFYSLIAAAILLFGYMSNYYNAKKEAYQNYDFFTISRLEQDASFEILLSIGAVVFYVIFLFLPFLAYNSLTEMTFSVIEWVYALPIIGFLIGIGGVLFLIGMVLQGITAAFVISGMVYSSFRKDESNGVEHISESVPNTDSRAEVIEYNDYNKDMPLTCFECGWEGTPNDGSKEYYDDLFDVSCPKCGKMLLVVEHSLIRDADES